MSKQVDMPAIAKFSVKLL